MRSKRYQQSAAMVEADRTYTIAQAVELLKKIPSGRFDATVELHIRLGLDRSHSDQSVRGSVTLPHGTGKTKRIAVFAEQAKQEAARQSGANVVGGEELIAAIKSSGKCEFDVAIATPAMMPKLAGIAKILGPKGLMPSPKNDTITTAIAKTIEELNKGKITFKNDATGNVHVTVGKASWENARLVENIQRFLEALLKAKPSSSKGVFIKTITLASTMGPGIRVSL